MNLIIETTRRCNMSCAHCLRGESQQLTLPPDVPDILFRNLNICGIDNIHITFSGGEPSLVPEVLRNTLLSLKKHSIALDSFYIATNGLDIPEAFILNCLRLYHYSEDKSACLVHISNDYYHALEGNYSTELLSGLSFFERKFSDEATSDFNCINEGRYKEIFNDSKRQPDSYDIQTKDDFHNANIYLNCYGELINGCDWSYSSQPSHHLCHVANFATYYNSLKEED